MTKPTRDDVLIQLDRIDSALEAPDADKAALMEEARDWLGKNASLDAADALYYRDRLQAIRERHDIG